MRRTRSRVTFLDLPRLERANVISSDALLLLAVAAKNVSSRELQIRRIPADNPVVVNSLADI